MAGARPVIPFALNPAQAITGIIDFTVDSNVKLHKRATSKLSEDLFDCVPEDLNQFLKTLSDRASKYSWNDNVVGIMMIPEDPSDPNTDYKNLLTNHGEITLEQIRRFEASYIMTSMQAAQDTSMLYLCLMSSLSKQGKTKIMVWEQQYKINGFASGNLLLKIIIRESHLDSNATTTVIRRQLSSLDTYINTIGCDITKFNGYVQKLLEGLSARGETTHDLLTNLFKGYQAASDHTFVKYIERKQEEYKDGLDITSTALMDLADKKYKTLKITGVWNAPSQQEEKILALTAEIEKIKRRRVVQKDTKTDKRQEEKITSVRKPKWLQQNESPPQEYLYRPCTWNKRKWYWCSQETQGKCGGKWRCHKPSECKGKAFKSNEKRKKKEEHDQGKKLKLTPAMQSILNQDYQYSDTDEDQEE